MTTSDPSSPSSTSSSSAPRLDRRAVFGVAAALAAVPGAVLLSDLSADATPRHPGGRLALRPDAGSVTRSLDVPVGPVHGRAVTSHAVTSAVMETTEFSALGVTWKSGTGTVHVRTRTVGGGWTSWRTLRGLHDRPDLNTPEGRATPLGTDLAWVGASDAVQLRVEGTQVAPTLTLIDPGHAPSDLHPKLMERTATGGGSSSGEHRHPRFLPVVPPLHPRREWHPNPKWMNPPIARISTVKQVHVHHTDNANGYSRADVPRMIRAMMRYHAVTLGWADIAYNFLVDRFGRIWVGRRGSMVMARGAHTLGFNHSSVGIAAIGNFQKGHPTDAMVHAIARTAAWKLALFDRNPKGRIAVISSGSDKFRAGRRVVLPVIDGHRNTNDTDCPGNHLYRELGEIRSLTAHRISRFDPKELRKLKAQI